jgi:hypothetical protein
MALMAFSTFEWKSAASGSGRTFKGGCYQLFIEK